ncbi:MAG: glycosyltransferase family 9 protein [Candidatus Omnitrophica bacterium]|nr:glycosyltransferase family 9 protein [Candidatus Omnitrophota bacterium]
MLAKNFRNILIVRTDRMGDVVLTTPAIKAIKKAFPMSCISVLVTPATYDLVDGNPYIDKILVDDRGGKHRTFIGFLRLICELYRLRFDLAIIFHTKRRYNLACWMAGIPHRLGFKNNKFGFLLNHPLRDERHLGIKHEAEYCLDVLKALGIEKRDLSVFVPVQKAAQEWVGHWMQENGCRSQEIIAIHPGASDPARWWSVDNFAQLMERLSSRYTLKIVLIGGEAIAPIAQQILSQTRVPSMYLNLTGKTTMAQMVSLLRHTRLLISNDSGPVHVAAGLGTSVISLFLRDMPGVNPKRWSPLGPKGFILKTTSKQGQPPDISVDDVLELTEKIFRRTIQYEIF